MDDMNEELQDWSACGDVVGHYRNKRVIVEVKKLLDAGADPDFGLEYAVETGNEELVELLLEAGANATPWLGNAMRIGIKEIIKLLLDYSFPNLNIAEDYNSDRREDAMHYLEYGLEVADSKGDLDMVRWLIKYMIRSGGQSELVNLEDRIPSVKRIIDEKVHGELSLRQKGVPKDVARLITKEYLGGNGKDEALQEYAEYGDIDEVKKLLDEGADPNIALDIAVMNEDFDMVRLLLDEEAEAGLGLESAVNVGNKELVELLLDNSFANLRNENIELLNDALRRADVDNNLEIARVLVNDYIYYNKKAELVRLNLPIVNQIIDEKVHGELSLRQKGVPKDVARLITKEYLGGNGKDEALQEYAEYGDIDEVKKLLDEGADPNIALDIAVMNEDFDMVRLLLDEEAEAGLGLESAVNVGNKELVELLLDNSFANLRNENIELLNDALRRADVDNNLEIARVLVNDYIYYNKKAELVRLNLPIVNQIIDEKVFGELSLRQKGIPKDVARLITREYLGGGGSGIISSDLEDFLNNPEKFVLSEEDYNRLEDGKSTYELDKSIDMYFEFNTPNLTEKPFCTLMGYYDGSTFNITDFRAEPEGYGYGSQCIAFLSEKLNHKGISLDYLDATDEAEGFWEKMYEKGYFNQVGGEIERVFEIEGRCEQGWVVKKNEYLGSGAEGEVQQVCCADNCKYAMKNITLVNEEMRIKFFRELYLSYYLDTVLEIGPHVYDGFIGKFPDSSCVEGGYYDCGYIVTEKLDKRLLDILEDGFGKKEEFDNRFILYMQMMDILKILSDNSLVQNDPNLGNWMTDSNNDLVMIDFGQVVKLENYTPEEIFMYNIERLKAFEVISQFGDDEIQEEHDELLSKYKRLDRPKYVFMNDEIKKLIRTQTYNDIFDIEIVE